ncbi:hypothetical protein GCM10010994_55730 [Chelatococcus reniformis]|uniref:Uncharacterized protein n=1 Tax=Chelatococcus reniformis TaxID=1494448 RepID=A0A916XQF2_9HYPH|nr:hypothetical protein GCM10010994_55730 [Chelatococcus reniformis]
MMRWLLGLFGYRIEYGCDWGFYEHRYDAIDFHIGRPIHRDMSVAPPWAKARIVRATPTSAGRG